MRSRLGILQHCAEHSATYFSSHFAETPAGHIFLRMALIDGISNQVLVSGSREKKGYVNHSRRKGAQPCASILAPPTSTLSRRWWRPAGRCRARDNIETRPV